MVSVNTKIKDKAIAHSIDLLRVMALIAPENAKRLDVLRKELIRLLMAANIWNTTGTVNKHVLDKRLNALFKKSEEMVKEAYGLISNDQKTVLAAVVQLTETHVVASLNAAINVRYAYNSISERVLGNIVDEVLFEGAPVKDWWERRSVAFHNRFKDTVRDGFIKGLGSAEIARNLRGTKVNNYRDSVFIGNFRSAESLVRTSMNAVANQTKLVTFDANADVVKAVEWVATLDSRTTDICRALDGLTWTIPGYKPIGHGQVFPGSSAHWGERSIVVAVVKSFDELKHNDALKIPVGTRASMDGQVSAKLNYDQWLKTKSVSFQKKILGVGKQKLWADGKIGFTDLVNQSNKPLTLKQVRSRL